MCVVQFFCSINFTQSHIKSDTCGSESHSSLQLRFGCANLYHRKANTCVALMPDHIRKGEIFTTFLQSFINFHCFCDVFTSICRDLDRSHRGLRNVFNGFHLSDPMSPPPCQLSMNILSIYRTESLSCCHRITSGEVLLLFVDNRIDRE